MKGCPEGGEQGFLFSLYQSLTSGTCPCPYQCGNAIERKKSDMFALYVRISILGYLKTKFQQPDFKEYISRLDRTVRQTCSKCSRDYCLACGESYSQSEKPRPGIAAEDNLFHCANLQGVIVGMGLAMVQKQYDMQTSPNSAASPEEPEKKKRKLVDTVKSTALSMINSSPTSNDEDDGLLPFGKKVKNTGIGYAGSVREDVR